MGIDYKEAQNRLKLLKQLLADRRYKDRPLSGEMTDWYIEALDAAIDAMKLKQGSLF